MVWEDTTAVVIDVLRATTTIAAALAARAAFVVGRETVKEAFALRAAMEGEGRNPVLGGERSALRVPGFDLGNSPREYRPEVVAGRPVILCTTNGTKALARCSRAKEVYAAALVNAGATARAVAERSGDVLLVCAGSDGGAALEDIGAAGLLATLLLDSGRWESDDATTIARRCWSHYRRAPLKMLREGRHGRALAALGFGEDLEFAAAVDSLNVVARRRGDGISADVEAGSDD